jgi:hypothetical protein
MQTTNTKSVTKLALGAALLAAALSLGGAAFGDLAIAGAFPSESVRNGYAGCVNKVSVTDPGYDANVKKCCEDYGGTYKDGPNAKGCVLPEAQPAKSTPNLADIVSVEPQLAPDQAEPANPPTKFVPRLPKANVSIAGS